MRARVLLIVAVAVAAGVVAVLALRGPERGTVGDGGDGTSSLGAPFGYDDARRDAYERAAADGLAHVLYAKSPGGAAATAERVTGFRDEIERAADGSSVDPDVLEGIVFLESAGRPLARASDDVEGAVGLTQILAETGRNLLDMRIDPPCRRRPSRLRCGRRVDDRLDPRKALEATVRYLEFARSELEGSDELAVVGYHMGVGNLQDVLEDFGASADVPWASVFFGTTPVDRAEAHDRLSGLGDDSSTYLWRVRAAQRIMAMHREDPAELARLAVLQTARNSAEQVLHPPGSTPVFEDPFALGRAQASGDLARLDPEALREDGLRIDPQMGELAPRLRQSRRLYRALTPDALATLRLIGRTVREITGDDDAVLTVTSSARDEDYQALLRGETIEAASGYSIHTTGWAFDIARRYASREQARAFQFVLDRLQALDRIAWVREPGAIHVTAGR